MRNRGELSEGWYDPTTLQKAQQSASDEPPRNERLRSDVAEVELSHTAAEQERGDEESDSDDSVGPTLPGQERSRSNRMGPSIPSVQDLELKRGTTFHSLNYLLDANISFRDGS